MSETPAGIWAGCDPGGDGKFGVAALKPDGTFVAGSVSGVVEGLKWFEARPRAIGVDAPLWWCARPGGGRRADQWLRDTYRIDSGTVQSVNSLKGAAIAQAPLFIERARQRFGPIPVTETHPKALLRALRIDWPTFQTRFGISGEVSDEHQRDAVIGAVAAREAFSSRWCLDLANDRYPEEQDPSTYWLAPIHYFWPSP